MDAYYRGTEVTLEAAVTLGGTPTDPDSITLEVKRPGTAVATYTYAAAELTRTGVGTFTRAQVLDVSGAWYYRFSTSGNVTAARWKFLPVIDDPLD